MPTKLPDTLDLQTEGFYFNFFATPQSTAAVRIGSFSFAGLEELSYEQIEPLQMFSILRARPLQATRVPQREKRGIRMPWAKKTPALYQVTGLVTLMLATSGLPARAPIGGARLAGNTPALVHQPKTQEPASEDALTQTPIHLNRIRGDRLIVVPIDEPPYTIEDLSTWPDPSPRPTTIETARALRDATREDATPILPPLVVDDGLGI